MAKINVLLGIENFGISFRKYFFLHFLSLHKIQPSLQKVFLFLSFLLLLNYTCHAQVVQEDFSEDEAFAYKSELTFGIQFNTTGGIPGGVKVKYAWQREKNSKQFNNVTWEIVNVKHPKELRLATDSGNGFFILHKTHYLFVVRTNYSREFLLFRKSSEEGIEMKLIASAGPSLGIVKPYYVIQSEGRGRTSTVPYREGDNIGPILGSSFFSGFGESEIVPGINARTSIEFGISAWDTFVTGIELGFQIEAFPKKIPIMAYAYNRSIFTSAFVNFYFGKRY